MSFNISPGDYINMPPIIKTDKTKSTNLLVLRKESLSYFQQNIAAGNLVYPENLALRGALLLGRLRGKCLEV